MRFFIHCNFFCQEYKFTTYFLTLLTYETFLVGVREKVEAQKSSLKFRLKTVF